MDTIATEDLVQFAAEKLGLPIYPLVDPPKERVAHVCHTDRERWELITPYRDYQWNFRLFDLSSWVLFGQGLTVFREQKDYHFVIECPLITLVNGKKLSSVSFNETGISGLPIAFWQVWYQLEHT